MGPQGKIPNVNLAFLEKGKTTRAEVEEKLSGIDVGIESEHVFVGRWRSSKLGAWLAVGGYGGAAVSADRIWHNANLLVKFDSANVVETYEVFPDKLLVSRLEPLAHEMALDPEEQEQVTILGGAKPNIPATLVLTAQSIEVTGSILEKHGKKVIHYAVPARELTAVHLERYQDDTGLLRTDLLFASDLRIYQGPHGRHLHVLLSVRQLVEMLAFEAEQTGRSGSGSNSGVK